MNKLCNGARVYRAPFYLCWLLTLSILLLALLPAAGSAAPAAMDALPAGNTATSQVVMTADSITFHETEDFLLARGNVRIWYGDMTLTANEAQAGLKAQLVKARGDVVLQEQGRQMNCAELDYDINSRQAYAHGILFASDPWFYQGESVEKIGEKQLNISQARFTTCNAKHPHFYMSANRIEVVLGESLTAYDVVLYIGTTPVFFIPWVHRSLKDNRPPFSIKVGYNDFEGFFTKIKYNYFLWENNYGGILLDLMQKKGLGTGIDHHWQYKAAGSGEGDFSGYYSRDNEQQRERWTGSLFERHEFSTSDQLQLNAEYISDRAFNREYTLNLVDSYQQKSNLAYSHRGTGYYFGASIADVETFDLTEEKYLPSSRELPNLTYSLYSQRLGKFAPPLYFSASSTFSRSLNIVQVLSDRRYRYVDSLRFNPGLTQTLAAPQRIPTQPSLSLALSLPISASYLEERYEDYGSDLTKPQPDWNAAYTTSLALTNTWVNYRYTKPTHKMQSRITHEFSRQLPILENTPLAREGITGHYLRLATDYYMGSIITLQGSTAYNLLKAEDGLPWQKSMDTLSFNGQANLGSVFYLTCQGVHDWEKERISSGYLAINSSGRKWNAALSGSYSFLGTTIEPQHSIYSTFNAGYTLPWGISLNGSLQYNVMKQKFTYYSLGAAGNLHCWQMQGSFKLYEDGKTEIGMGLTLKAFPELTIGMGGDQGMSVGGE